MSEIFEEVSFTDLPNDCIRRSQVFQQAILGASSQVLKESCSFGTKYDYFRDLSLALLIRTILCKQGQRGSSSKSIGDRITLIATFVQGVNCTKDLIMGGYHFKAAGSLKQDYEVLARLREIQVGKAKAGGTPNVRHAPDGSQRIYGSLNDFAHPSKEPLILRHLRQLNQNGIPGVNPFPKFIERTFEVHIWTHIWLIYEFCREGIKVLAENYGWEDEHVRDCADRWDVVESQGIACGLLRVNRIQEDKFNSSASAPQTETD